MLAKCWIDALHRFGAEDDIACSDRELRATTRPLELLVFGFFTAVRLGRLLGALARAFRSGLVVGVVIGFLHRDLQNKTTRVSPQDFFADIEHTKVTGGGNPPPAASLPSA